MSGEYKPRTYMNAVLRASRSTHSARAVLLVMCWQSEFNRPEVTITKPQIAQETGLSDWSIRMAIRRLKSEGSIEVVRNRLGGRGNAPTYRLNVSKGGDNQRKGGDNQRKGGDNIPPSIDSISSTGDAPVGTSERSAASRGTIDDLGQAAPAPQTTDAARAERRRSAEKREGQGAGGGAPLTPERRQQVERFSLAMRLAGEYGGAVRLIEAWDAGTIPEGRAE